MTSTRTTRTTTLLALALSGTLLLSACGSSETTGTASAPGASSSPTAAATATIPADAAYNTADVDFVVGMRPHHVQAVEMADLVLAADPSEPVADLARRIKAEQTPEIAQLDAMLATFGAEDAGHGDGHSSMGMSGMSGMMSDEDMTALGSATGAEASRLFLEGMVRHHEGAVAMAEAELATGKYPQARELATAIKAAQQQEITEMKQLLGQA